MITEIEEKYQDILENDWLYKLCVAIIVLFTIIIIYLVHLKIIPIYSLALCYVIPYILAYIISLAELKIKLFSLRTLTIFKTWDNFGKLKHDRRKRIIINIIKAYNSFNRKDILFLLSFYENKIKKKDYIDKFFDYGALVTSALEVTMSFISKNASPEIFSNIISWLFIIFFFIFIFRIIYKKFIKPYSRKMLEYDMYEEIVLILDELYFEVNKEKPNLFTRIKNALGIN